MKLKLEFWYCPFKDVDITNIGNVHYTYRAFHKLLNTVKVPISFKTVIYVFDIMKLYDISRIANNNNNTHNLHNSSDNNNNDKSNNNSTFMFILLKNIAILHFSFLNKL